MKTEVKTAGQQREDLLFKHIRPFNTKENNKAPLETQLTLVVQAAQSAMQEWSDIQNSELKKENERLREALDRILFELDHEDEANITLAYFIAQEALNPPKP